MRDDVNGRSSTLAGQEKYEFFDTRRGNKVQYDYRTIDGVLFSVVAGTLEQARNRRDVWLEKQKK
ncbi:MAG: DUF3873 family protein [Candidatus Cloacimonetes bacterium]|nr:DUF3873 family protein [Candidatus Cloacimonadota bacterium]